MANEYTLTLSLTANRPASMSSAISRALTGLLRNSGGAASVGPQPVLIGTSATAFPLANVATPYYAWFYNLDTNNYVQLQNGASGAVFARLRPGDACIIPLDPACVPYGVANTAAVEVEYWILS